ncbi:hypothetical protein Riv7116_3574 [Rivularia sp. PCC 7116]|uniref:hypothetical protein n=1 Tax=Rivularia sp. PCC 7116 TaxID=373994 RepID=UPI00029EEF0D|nr:hypothetical protein [Rivularia sp. PCC 7116]AFY56025.1 hypothetical protein Riv7116_3574 [Rivularia sp. PCC 7116]
MTKVQYPTLDLFLYNRIEDSDKIRYDDYWNALEKKLLENGFTVKKDAHEELLEFEINTNKIDGSYLRVQVQDAYYLNYCCSIDKEVESSQLSSFINQYKKYLSQPGLLPKLDNLDAGKLSKQGFFGQTWMLSGWTIPNNSQISENEAFDVYQNLIGKPHQYYQAGEFFGAQVYEMWRGDRKWEGIEKNSHVVVVFYPDKQTFNKIGEEYYTAWRDLFLYRHKMIWAYENGRKLKLRLMNKYGSSLTNTTDLSKKGLQELKDDLLTNTNNLSTYVRDINDLDIQKHTVEVNLYNYDTICEHKFFDADFLQSFSKIVKDKYKIQLEKDYLSLNPDLAILENVTSTIRGMVEIEQAKEDRNLSNTVAILGIGLATSQLTSAVIIAQQPPSKDIPFYQTKAFQYSLLLGIASGISVWLIIRLNRLLQHKK